MFKVVVKVVSSMFKAAKSSVRESRNKGNVYGKYIILDAVTLRPKDGMYFVLKLDSEDKNESYAVHCGLLEYANAQRRRSRFNYARSIEEYVVKSQGLKL